MMPTPLPALVWAVIFCILLVRAVAIFTLDLIRGHRVKRKNSRYRSSRSRDWVKTRNPEAPAIKREAEED